jgi:dTMP kinase
VAGRFITLEGGEGAGKSTLLAGLNDALTARGVVVTTTREPGGTPAANDIRELLVRGAGERWSVLSEALLFAAARNDHLERLIRPTLAGGAWVISDRYMDSTYAYQVAGRGLPADTFDTLHRLIGALKPDLTLILDIDPENGVARSRGHASGESRFETMDAAFHARVRASFHALAAREPERCVVIDAAQDKPAVLAAALNAIAQHLDATLGRA